MFCSINSLNLKTFNFKNEGLACSLYLTLLMIRIYNEEIEFPEYIVRSVPSHFNELFGTFYLTGLILLLSYERDYGYLLFDLTCLVINYSLWSLNTQKSLVSTPFRPISLVSKKRLEVCLSYYEEFKSMYLTTL